MVDAESESERYEGEEQDYFDPEILPRGHASDSPLQSESLEESFGRTPHENPMGDFLRVTESVKARTDTTAAPPRRGGRWMQLSRQHQRRDSLLARQAEKGLREGREKAMSLPRERRVG